MKLTDIVALIAILLLVTAVVVMSIIAIRLALPDSRIRFIRPSTAKVYDLTDRRDIYERSNKSSEEASRHPDLDEDESYNQRSVC